MSAASIGIRPLWLRPRRWLVFFSALALVCAILAFGPNGSSGTSQASATGHWTSVLPPVIAVLLAFCFRNFIVALSSAVLFGAVLAYGPKPWVFLPNAAVELIWNNLVAYANLAIFGFIFCLVGLVHVIGRSGGIHGLVDVLTRIARSQRSARFAAITTGLVLFFDDYANTVVVGSTMRKLFDRWRISREKLAYIVDSTSAPVAGVAVLSTWIAFEVFLFSGAVADLGIAEDGFGVFLAALPMRFYCFGSLIFVVLNAALQRDFGPMRQAEVRAAIEGKVIADDARPFSGREETRLEPEPGVPHRWYNAAIPLFIVIFGTIGGIAVLGRMLIVREGGTFSITSADDWRAASGAVGASGSGAVGVLFWAALLGCLVAIVLARMQRLLTVRQSARAWIGAFPTLWMTVFILVMAWAMKTLCADLLNTDAYLVALLGDRLPLPLLPALVFLIGALMSFALGTSWGTMGVLIPVVLPLAHSLGAYEEGHRVIFWLTASAVLDGAIFGDHCSPISDTTVLSSLASGCDHLHHVGTQFVYAVSVMLLAAVLGYLPAAIGMPVAVYYASFPVAVCALFFLVGRPLPSSPK